MSGSPSVRLRSGATLGAFRLVERLGGGAVAEIWAAEEAKGGAYRALKILLPSRFGEPHEEAMFRDEAELGTRLRHPNIIRTYGLAEADGFLFQIMDIERGIDLDIALRRLGRPVEPWFMAVHLIREVAEGMDFAHQVTGSDGQPLGLVHRDLTPSNVFLGWDGTVKVLDFGIAWTRQRRERTEQGVVKGKMDYVAPEFILHRDFDHRADIYSLGVVAERMALSEEAGHQLEQANVPGVDAIAPGMPRDFLRLVEAMLQPRPENRPSSMRDVADSALSILRAAAIDDLRCRKTLQRVLLGPSRQERREGGRRGSRLSAEGTAVRAHGPASGEWRPSAEGTAVRPHGLPSGEWRPSAEGTAVRPRGLPSGEWQGSAEGTAIRPASRSKSAYPESTLIDRTERTMVDTGGPAETPTDPVPTTSYRPQPGNVVGSGYELLRAVNDLPPAQGYLARSSASGQAALVRFLPTSERFEREAARLLRIRSPYLLNVLEYGHVAADLGYVVLEAGPQPTLAQFLGRNPSDPSVRLSHRQAKEAANEGEPRWVDGASIARGPIDRYDRLECLRDAVSGLADLHARGLVHGYLSARHLRVQPESEGSKVKLDIAIPERFLTDVAAQSPLLSPEHGRGHPLPPATDIYLLGLLLREVLEDTPAPLVDELLQPDPHRRPPAEVVKAQIEVILQEEELALDAVEDDADAQTVALEQVSMEAESNLTTLMPHPSFVREEEPEPNRQGGIDPTARMTSVQRPEPQRRDPTKGSLRRVGPVLVILGMGLGLGALLLRGLW